MRIRPLKALLAGAGFLCIGVGTLGIFVPVLPTVPLFLLGLFCFERSSDKLHGWFKTTFLYKRYLEEFMENRAMTMRAKLTILISVGVLLIVTAILINSWIARGIIVVLIIIMNWYFFTHIKTITASEAAAIKAKKEAAAQTKNKNSAVQSQEESTTDKYQVL